MACCLPPLAPRLWWTKVFRHRLDSGMCPAYLIDACAKHSITSWIPFQREDWPLMAVLEDVHQLPRRVPHSRVTVVAARREQFTRRLKVEITNRSGTSSYIPVQRRDILIYALVPVFNATSMPKNKRVFFDATALSADDVTRWPSPYPGRVVTGPENNFVKSMSHLAKLERSKQCESRHSP